MSPYKPIILSLRKTFESKNLFKQEWNNLHSQSIRTHLTNMCESKQVQTLALKIQGWLDKQQKINWK